MQDAPAHAAQYVRMSTEHQNYSIEYQAAANLAYALERGYEIVRTYTDAGVSGLGLKRRSGLQALLSDVVAGRAGYSVVLVYDVSRWGRFQDPDESAHYEFLCRTAGVRVEYTAEPFANDGSLTSVLVKHLKRAMAAEYSRELSQKVARAQRGLHGLGYWQGSTPGYGLRRLSVAPTGASGLLMQYGEAKALHGHRTRLVHGPEHEVATVRRIYDLFISGMRIVAIAGLLNREGVAAEGGAAWTRQRVRSVLTNEKYAGVLVAGKSGGAVGERRRRRLRSEWRRTEGAVEPIVSRRRFDLAQSLMPKRSPPTPPPEELLAELRQVLAERGRLTARVIDSHPGVRNSSTFRRCFGSLAAAFVLIGYELTPRQQSRVRAAAARGAETYRGPPLSMTEEEGWTRLEAHFARLGRVSKSTIDLDPDLPGPTWFIAHFGGLARVYQRLGYQPDSWQRFHLERTKSMTRGPGHRASRTP